jgi:hypothetical protein
MKQDVKINLEVGFLGAKLAIQKIWRYNNELYVLSQLDMPRGIGYPSTDDLSTQAAVEVGETRSLNVNHYLVVNPYSEEAKRAYFEGYPAKIIRGENHISQDIRLGGECLFSREEPALVEAPQPLVDQTISIDFSVPYAGCRFNLLHIWEFGDYIAVTSRLDYCAGVTGFGNYAPTHFHADKTVKVAKELPVKHYLVVDAFSESIEWTPSRDYNPLFIKRDVFVPIKQDNCLYENARRDSDLRRERFYEEHQAVAKLRVKFFNEDNQTKFKLGGVVAFVRAAIDSQAFENALKKDEHSVDEKINILIVGEMHHVITRNVEKGYFNDEEGWVLLEQLLLDRIDRTRLAVLFNKYDTVYKKPAESYFSNKHTFFAAAGAALVALTTAALVLKP